MDLFLYTLVSALIRECALAQLRRVAQRALLPSPPLDCSQFTLPCSLLCTSWLGIVKEEEEEIQLETQVWPNKLHVSHFANLLKPFIPLKSWLSGLVYLILTSLLFHDLSNHMFLFQWKVHLAWVLYTHFSENYQFCSVFHIYFTSEFQWTTWEGFYIFVSLL